MAQDVAGSLFTSMHRQIKIEGRSLPKTDMEGTGSVSGLQARRTRAPTRAARHVSLQARGKPAQQATRPAPLLRSARRLHSGCDRSPKRA